MSSKARRPGLAVLAVPALGVRGVVMARAMVVVQLLSLSLRRTGVTGFFHFRPHVPYLLSVLISAGQESHLQGLVDNRVTICSRSLRDYQRL